MGDILMKKAIVIIILLLIYANISAESLRDKVYLDINGRINNTTDTENAINETLYYDFINSKLPSDYAYPFYYYTRHNKKLGIELIAIGDHESGWRGVNSTTNSNGSRDVGVLQLNSYNIKNYDFMNQFTPKDKTFITSLDVLYMTVCVNYYEHLIKQMNNSVWFALKVYNGGYRAISKQYANSRLDIATTRYANQVYDKIKIERVQFERFCRENRDDTRNRVIKLKAEQALEEMEQFNRTLAQINVVNSIKEFNNVLNKLAINKETLFCHEKRIYQVIYIENDDNLDDIALIKNNWYSVIRIMI